MNSHPPPPQAHEREPTAKTPNLALTLDLETYLSQLDDWDISREQKTEFIITFWNLLLSFAEIGFEIHPSQLAANTGRKSSTKIPNIPEKPGVLQPPVVYSRPYHRTRIIQKSDAHIAADNKDSKRKEQRP